MGVRDMTVTGLLWLYFHVHPTMTPYVDQLARIFFFGISCME